LQDPNEVTPQKVKRGGPEIWFQGYPNLIYYSRFYGNKHNITMKELVKRKSEIDEQIKEKVEIVYAINKTIEYFQNKPTEKTMIDLFDHNLVRFKNKLEDSQEEWKWIDACCKEMEQKQKHV
jgi:hypothetical protein